MLEAGRKALARGAWDEARREFEHAVARDPRSAEALDGLGIALYWLDEPEVAFSSREAAYLMYMTGENRREAARVAIGIASQIADFSGVAVALRWLERAHNLLQEIGFCVEHGWLALWEGHFARAIDRDLPKARGLVGDARSIARTLKHRDLELVAVALEGLINVTDGKVREGMKQLDEAMAAAMVGEPSEFGSMVATCCFLLQAFERVRDHDRAALWGRQIESLARRWSLGSIFAMCQTQHAAILVGRGEYAEAETILAEALQMLESRRPRVAFQATVQLAELRRRQGRIDEAVRLFSQFDSTPEAMIGLAAIALDRGDVQRAADLAQRMLRKKLVDKWAENAMAFDLLVRSRIALGDIGGAQSALNGLNTLVEAVDTPITRGIAAGATGALLAAGGDHVGARAYFEDAIDRFESCCVPYEAARARLDLAFVLRQLGHESFACAELVAASGVFRKLGADADRDRAEVLLGNT